MSYVEFYRTTGTGQEHAGRITLTNGVMSFEGIAPNLSQELQERGVRFWVNGISTILTPKDGIAFLKALPTVYSGDYLRAAFLNKSNLAIFLSTYAPPARLDLL
jgi:hypothetical protein